MSTTSTPVGLDRSPATASPPAGSDRQIVSFEEWEQDSHHRIWTHGGKTILIRIPDLFELVRSDALPQGLRTIALEVVTRQAGLDAGGEQQQEPGPRGLRWEEVQQTAELFEHLAFSMIVEPAITVDQFRRLPSEDREMLRDIAMRQRNTDARGVLLGTEPLSRWETFRHEHGCPPDCTSCQKALDRVATHGGVQV